MDREIYDNYDIYHWYLSPLMDIILSTPTIYFRSKPMLNHTGM